MPRPVRPWALIQSSFPAQCTAWRRTCTRPSSQPRAQVRRDQAGAAAVEEEDFPAAASEAEAAARSRNVGAGVSPVRYHLKYTRSQRSDARTIRSLSREAGVRMQP